MQILKDRRYRAVLIIFYHFDITGMIIALSIIRWC